MGRLVENEGLNYWLCGLIFTIVFGIATMAISIVRVIPMLGWIVYLAVMPYVAGRLVDFVSDRWMD
ncbi:hypothetical protein CW700_03345 [Candidatus Bathyarchaeota archaeon]|nr:hypothetical protein [Candidatus Bathyarchaeota archaeon]RJS89734.1 MAG: hypothetical protein CW700_03345 [Candidatus Bathyarchaeota archaeon]